MRSIFCDSCCTARSTPTRLSAGVRARSASRTSAKPALDAGKRRPVGAGVARVVDAVGELAHLCFERLDRLARHGLLQHQADLGEIVAQRVDRLVDAAGLPQRLDPGVDLAKLLLETG